MMKINPAKLNHWSWIACSVVFISISLMGLTAFWDDTSWFLFEFVRLDPRGLPKVDGHRVWQASHGVRHLFTMLVFAAIALLHGIRLVKLHRQTKRDAGA